MKRDFDSPLLGYRKRQTGEIKAMVESTWIGLDYQGGGIFNQLAASFNLDESQLELYKNKDIDYFVYSNTIDNNYLNRFEDICNDFFVRVDDSDGNAADNVYKAFEDVEKVESLDKEYAYIVRNMTEGNFKELLSKVDNVINVIRIKK
jgi:flagellin-specific chaperone FliS